MPLVPWDIDPTTHVALVHEHLRLSLCSNLPPVPKRARNPAYSEATVEVVRHKRRARRRVKELASREGRTLLAATFAAMRPMAASRAEVDRHAAELQEARRQKMRVAAALFFIDRHLRDRMQSDRASFLRAEMQGSRDLGGAHFAFRIRALLRSGRKFKAPALLPLIAPGTHNQAAGQTQVLFAMGSHYAAAEGGVCSTTTASLAYRASHPVAAPAHPINALQMPSMAQFTRALAGIKCGRAPGISGIHPEVYRMCPHLAAMVLHPVHCKAIAHGCMPLQWVGGKAHSIPKPNGATGSLTAWRSIMLLEPESKALQRAYRPALLSAVKTVGSVGQHGGMPGQTLQMASFRVRAHFLHLKNHNISGGALFLDSRTAYYSVVRDLLTMTSTDNANLADALRSRAQQFFTTDDAQTHFVAKLEQGGLLRQAAASSETCRFVQALVEGAWFATDPDTGVIWNTATGTVPGSPIADTLFSIVYASFLNDLQAVLQREGLAIADAKGGDSDVPTWADDTAVLFVAGHPDQLLGALQTVTESVCRGIARLGLTANLGAGKTEAVLSVRGYGCKRVCREIFCPECPGIHFEGPTGQQQFVRIVSEYTHLGSVLRSDGHELPNIKARARLARAAYTPLRKRILANPYLTVAEKREIFTQRVISKYVHGAGLWQLRTAHERSAAHEPIRHAMRSSLKAITGISSHGLNAEQVAALLELPTAEETLAVARIRTAREAACLSAPAAWQAYLDDGCWLRQVGADLAEAWKTVPPGNGPLVPTAPAGVLEFVRAHSHELKGICRRYLAHCVKARSALAVATKAKVAAFPPATHSIYVEDDFPELDDGFVCVQCGKTLPCSRTLAVHMARAHHRLSDVTRMTTGTRCEVCRTEFWEPHRLRTHISRSRLCYHLYWHGDQSREDGSLVQSDRRLHASAPAVVTPGPQPFWASLRPD